MNQNYAALSAAHGAEPRAVSSCDTLWANWFQANPSLPMPTPMPGFALFIGDHLARSVRGRPGAPPH
jgi:hypothetical protein